MDYMEQALSLAKLAMGQVSPNPAVGAVIVNGEEVVGQGYTQPPGSAHAEIVALKQAGERARGGILYVTLEPCCHFGRTPPCTQAVISAGIKEVHLATLDPNPVVCQKGKTELEREGIRTYVGEHEQEAREIIEAYVKFMATGIPFVTVKFAMSLDGKIATHTGDSYWITGEEARRQVQNLRYTHDAIMVGANTVLADNPHLTVRSHLTGGRTKKQPLRVIIDGKGRTPPSAQLFHEPGRTLIALGESVKPEMRLAYGQSGAELAEFPSFNGMLDLKPVLETLGQRQITSVLVEGGGILVGSLFDAGLVDKVVAFIAPTIIGGQGAKTPVGGVGVSKVAESLRLERMRVRQFGEDIMVTGYIPRERVAIQY
ncbi:MAG: bifunctional diaminohydroxyphosphoribosylaminopyrimidine deaminase/5-amino-6-(5-phosphoribosylamino)uracil reductase RibD [Chloroflexi bacterium]|nr:bifunctional diaminohydroxyphosphoribosylaminopyrimidine deaminase/5-amino-6-(5-phosphoribosylamino)uracil reductase RibD [Chloroflexota bacterium]